MNTMYAQYTNRTKKTSQYMIYFQVHVYAIWKAIW